MATVAALFDLQSGYVIAAITLFALPIAAVAFARSGPAWRSIGKGPLSIEQALPPSRTGAAAPEVARLLAPGDEGDRQGLDAQLRAEVRELVLARNERRMRAGQPPLDVEAETERQLSDLIGLGE